MAENPPPPEGKLRVAIFNMFSLAEQYDLAAEFEKMLRVLTEKALVYHLSLGGPRSRPRVPDGVTVDELPMKVNRKSPRDILLKSILIFFFLPPAIVRLRRFKPNVIYLPDIIPMYGFFLKLFCGTKIALSYGDWHLHNKLGRKWWSQPVLRLAEFLEQLEVKTVDAFTCRSAAARERLKAWGVSPDRVRAFHDAPDLNAFNPRDESALRKAGGFEKDDVVLLYHGVMHQGKGLDFLLRWTADLHKENPKVGIFLVGDGPERKALKRLAADLGLEHRVCFTGWLKTTKEVGNYCNAADICIAMRTGAESNVHIVPGALLHSMACGKVVIGPRLPGIGEILRDGQNGFMFKADDGDDFKRLIRELIARRDLWETIGRNAYDDICRNYSIEATARRYGGALLAFAEM